MKRTKIGVAITTRNRSTIASRTLGVWHSTILDFNAQQGDYTAKLYIVDDASDIPVVTMYGVNFCRFDKNVGIARAKNKCIEMMYDGDCQMMFLVDDDTFVRDWRVLVGYVHSGLEHACYTFRRRFIQGSFRWAEYEMPCGCFLFFTRKCVDAIGGFDPEFQGYSYEHVNFSDRIFNTGLTPARYIDIAHTRDGKEPTGIISLDEQGTIEKSVPYGVRMNSIPVNYQRYLQKRDSKEYIDFRS